MKEAMRAKDRPRLEAVRLLRAAIQRLVISLPARARGLVVADTGPPLFIHAGRGH